MLGINSYSAVGCSVHFRNLTRKDDCEISSEERLKSLDIFF
jgi:hypothetical protein